MMEALIEFVKKFIALEYEVRIKKITEPDREAFEMLLNKLNSYYYGNILSSIRTGDAALNANEAAPYIESLQPKKLLKMIRYGSKLNQELYCAFLSSEFAGDNNYFGKYYITRIDKQLKIVAEYYICDDCDGTGIVDNKKCAACSGRGWIWRGGDKIEEETLLEIETLSF